MEVVALNDQLRDAFTPVLRHLQHQSPSPPTAESSDHCAQHGRTVLWRLNTRQYGSAPAFARDLQQLAQLATAPDTKRVIQVCSTHHRLLIMAVLTSTLSPHSL